jgi:hypothetical protein
LCPRLDHPAAELTSLQPLPGTWQRKPEGDDVDHTKQLRTILITTVLSGILSTLAYAQLGKILKGGAIALVVDRFGPQINQGINKLTGARNLSPGQATKVVPILSIGSGSYLGAVQVTGAERDLEKVKAVAQLEGRVNVIGGVRLRALVPIAARSVSSLKRVPGVGVSALVDIKL